MATPLLLPSMMCADFGHLAEEVAALEGAGVDGFHLDVMDGAFVPNYALGLGDVAFICEAASVPCDVHLMIEHAADHVQLFADAGAQIIYVHSESDPHIARTLLKIRESGADPGLAINPGTSLDTVRTLLPLVDHVLVMTVNPGFAGQPYLDFVDEKLERLIALGAEMGFSVVVDGACSPERIATLGSRGADGFVLGTSALFGKDRPYDELVRGLRAAWLGTWHPTAPVSEFLQQE